MTTVYKVEHNEANFYFKLRAEAMAFADDNDCYLVEGIKVEDSQVESLCIPYRQFRNTLSNTKGTELA